MHPNAEVGERKSKHDQKKKKLKTITAAAVRPLENAYQYKAWLGRIPPGDAVASSKARPNNPTHRHYQRKNQKGENAKGEYNR